MGREISISFALNAALGAGFKGVFQSASQSARNVTAAIREMEKSPVGHLGAAMAQQREKIKGLAGSLKEARATLATLQSQAQASGGATGMLARQIELAQSRVNNLNGAMSRQLGIWRNTAAQAATTGGSIRNLSQEYDHLSQRIERARRVQAAMAANRAQGDALRSQRADLNSKLTGAVAAAATVAAPVTLSIGFEDQMAKVGAVSRASEDDLAALTAQARQLGRDTSYSASQAAEGMQYLAMAGFKTKQTMAAMPGMLDLAAASGTDLGTTANIASNILSAFELKAEEMGHVGDVLTAAFTSSNTTLESLGETMKYVGPVAKDAGASIEDAVAMAAMLGNVGISGSQAGTTSKSIYARLAAPPTEAAKALNALNIKTKDAQGNLRAVPDLLEEITLKTASMGTADRTDVFSKVFGLEPMAGASALAKKAAETVDENGKQIVDSMGKPTTTLLKFVDELRHASDEVDGVKGVSRRVAAQMNATTGGALRRLSSAWQDAGIEVGNLFLPTIKDAADALSTVANAISGAVQRFPNLSKGIALSVGGFLALTAASVGIGLVLNLVRTSLNGFRGGLLRLSAAHIAATTSTAASTAAAGGFGIASRIAGAGAKFFAGGLRSILMATGVGALLVGLGVGINLLIDNWDAVVAAMSAAWGWVKDTWGGLGVFFSELGNNLAGIWPGIWGNVCQVASDAKASFISIWEDVSGYFANILEPLRNIFAGVWAGVISGANWCIGAVTSVWNGITGVADWACSAVISLWEGAVSYLAMLWDGISGIFTSVWNGIAGAATWAGDGIVGVWQGVVEFFGYAGQGISDCFSGVWRWVVDAAAWAWEGIAGIWTGVTDFFGGIVESIFGVFGRLFSWLQEKFAWVFSAIDAVGSAISSITGAVKGAWNAAFGDKKKEKSAASAANGEKATPAINGQKAGAASGQPTPPPLPERRESAAQNAQNALNVRKETTNPTAPPEPKYQPVSADAYHAAFDRKKGGSKSKNDGSSRKKASGSGRSGSGASSGSGAASGPVTVVTLDSGNEIKTQFFPAGARNAAPNATSAGHPAPSGQRAGGLVAGAAKPSGAERPYGFGVPLAGAASAFKSSGIGAAIGHVLQSGLEIFRPASGQPVAAPSVQTGKPPVLSISPDSLPVATVSASSRPALPQAPSLIARKGKSKPEAKQSGQQDISIALTQNFDLITQDSAAARKVLEAIKPDFEALVRKALAKIKSDRTRTAYAQ